MWRASFAWSEIPFRIERPKDLLKPNLPFGTLPQIRIRSDIMSQKRNQPGINPTGAMRSSAALLKRGSIDHTAGEGEQKIPRNNGQMDVHAAMGILNLNAPMELVGGAAGMVPAGAAGGLFPVSQQHPIANYAPSVHGGVGGSAGSSLPPPCPMLDTSGGALQQADPPPLSTPLDARTPNIGAVDVMRVWNFPCRFTLYWDTS